MFPSILIKFAPQIVAVLALAAIFWKIDDRAYHSGLDHGTDVCVNETVPAMRAVEQENCLANIKRVETSNANITRDKDNILAKRDASIKRLSQAAASQHLATAVTSMAEGGTETIQLPTESRSLGNRIIELGADAAEVESKFLECRRLELGIDSKN